MKNENLHTQKKKLTQSVFFLLTVMIFSLFGCSDDSEELRRTDWVRVLPLQIEFPSSGGEQEVTLIFSEDIDPSLLQCAVPESGNWCTFELKDKVLKVTATPTAYLTSRSTVLSLTYKTLRRDISVSQAASTGSDDIKIEVASATATTEETEQEDRGIEKSFDGDYSSYFNSKFGAFSDWPFIIDYTFKSLAQLDYIVYTPRTDNGTRYGAFNEFNVYVMTNGSSEWTKVAECARGDKNYTPTTIQLEQSYTDVKQVRFEIQSAHNNRISCAEMDFYQTNQNKFDYTTIFTDETCSALREGVTEKEITKMPGETYQKLALALLKGTYDKAYRIADYRPYQTPSIMASILKTSEYGLRDNPTGIYVEQGEEVLVLVGDTHGQNVSMIVQDLVNGGYNGARTYALKQGENKVKVETGGLVYIQNLTQDYIPLELSEADKEAAEAKTVTVHFPFGKVNGYYDVRNNTTQEEWEEMLRNTRWQDIDVVGKYVVITWAVQDYMSYQTPIKEMVDLFDTVVEREWALMGLFKYHNNPDKRLFANRMYLHIEHQSKNPYSSTNHTAYVPSYAEVFCSPERMKARSWVLGHEIGHSNQTRPGLKWTGTTEVTNNIMSMDVSIYLSGESKLNSVQTSTGKTYYQEAIDYIVTGNNPHCMWNWKADGITEEHMYTCKLVPFWQLKLFMDANGYTDFYPDLYEHFRVTPNLDTTVKTQGILQLDFVRQACKYSKINLLQFFEDWGFLTPVDTEINDYGTKPFIVYQEDIDALKAEISALGYPAAPAELYNITDSNWEDEKWKMNR
ncbi:M60 family metallopeptidase [Phocaeicola plebeius]|uniref:M60 family metallopeptidase n=1 Tax=Phocaeicola plebeius TaxID=310297 RepID=UPI003FF08798